MLRWTTVVLVVAAVAGGFLTWRAGSDAPPAAEERAAQENGATPNAAPAPEKDGGAEGSGGKGAGGNPEETSCQARESGAREKMKIGGFERPENAPAYEVLESERDSRDCARGAHLLVDTRSRDEAGFELIARDIKARYADLDAVSVEFTDATGVLDYEGAALIFNTPAGADYMGFVYGPPNNQGYMVQVAG